MAGDQRGDYGGNYQHRSDSAQGGCRAAADLLPPGGWLWREGWSGLLVGSGHKRLLKMSGVGLAGRKTFPFRVPQPEQLRRKARERVGDRRATQQGGGPKVIGACRRASRAGGQVGA